MMITHSNRCVQAQHTKATHPTTKRKERTEDDIPQQ